MAKIQQSGMAAELRFNASMRSLLYDLRYAFRGLRRSPAFTAIAVVLLALGTGANTAVFTVVHEVLLRPLPYPHPEQLVLMVRSTDAAAVTVPEYQFWKEHASSYQSAAAYRGAIDRELDTGGTLEWIKSKPVTAGFFRTLGVAPTVGREFTKEEASPGGPQAIILTDSLWRSALGGRADAVGAIVKLDGANYTIVGILPRGFWYPEAADAFTPLRFLGTIDDSGVNTAMISRLKPGIDLRQAEAEKAPLTEAFLRTNPAYLTRAYRGLTPFSYQEWLTGNGNLRTILLALLAAVFLLLLIACANLAGLLLARLAARRREIAVRLALGSGSPRLLRQFLLENAAIGAAGGLAGLLCAAWMLDGLLALMPFPQIPVSSPIHLNLPVLLSVLAAAIGVNLLLSFAPLLTSSRVPIVEALKSGNPQSGARQRMRGVLVALQVAISVALSISAALLIQSVYRLHQEKLGFSPKGVMTFWTPTALERRGKPEELKQFNAALLDRLRKLPGVHSAAAVNMLPFVGPNNFPTQREGHPEQSIGGMEIRAVTPDYFQTMGTRILYGRAFTEVDKDGAAPVVLVSQSVAARWWGQASPIGDRVVIGLFQGRPVAGRADGPRAVVGVVEDAKRLSVKEPSPPAVYVPLAQWDPGGMNWVLRGDFSPGFATELRQAIQEIDPRQRVERIRTMEAAVASSTADSRFDAWLFGLFSALALALTAIGIYGMLAFSVARRTHEIGTRIALGATPARVLRLVLKQGAGPVAVGVIAGVAAALGLTRLLSALLFHVRPTDWPPYAAVPALVLAVGILASFLPARRATKVDPLIALRSE